MINLKANARFKKLGSKWNGVNWEAPKLAKKEFEEIKKEFYEDLIAVEIEVKDGERLNSCDWTRFCHARTVGGYIVATAKGRDGGAEIYKDIAVINGTFSSGGSSKNFMCVHSDKLKIRMEVSKNALSYLDAEEEIYTYVIL